MKSKDTRKKGLDKFKNILDFWAINSDEAGWNISSTDEGSQKMLEEESEKQVQIQMGSDVVDDFIIGCKFFNKFNKVLTKFVAFE